MSEKSKLKVCEDDLTNLEEITKEGVVCSTCGEWSVHKYKKDKTFLLFVNREELHSLEFISLKDLIGYLNGKDVKFKILPVSIPPNIK